MEADDIATFLAIILAVGALLSPSSAGPQIILTLLFPPMFYTFFTKALASYENIPLTPNILRRSPDGDAPVLALLIVAIVSVFRYLTTSLDTDKHTDRYFPLSSSCYLAGNKSVRRQAA